MKNIHLPLKKIWFVMTKSGEKREDYREITPYWIGRLTMYQDGSEKLNKKELIEIAQNFIDAGTDIEDIDYIIDNWCLNFKKFKNNVMTLGYPKSTDKSRILTYEHAGIEMREGNPKWGAEPGKIYFVIKHGKRSVT